MNSKSNRPALKCKLLILALCAIGGDVYAVQDESLEKRVREYWQAQVTGDWGKVYDLTSPGDTVKSADRQKFIQFRQNNGPFVYVSADVGAVEVGGDVAWVDLRYSAKPKLMSELPPTSVQVWEQWYRKDNHWYPTPKELKNAWPSSPPSARPAAEERLLEQRVKDFWDARRQNDRERIYRYLAPEVRASVDKDKFLQGNAGNSLLEYAIDWVEIKDNAGKVRITYEAKSADPHLSKLPSEKKTAFEKWVKVNNYWYLDLASK